MSHVTHPLIKPNKIKLRRYQESVVARAIENNTLIVLPTGLGKTIVAAMIAAHRLHSFPKTKVLFLAPTRPLVVQHKETFEEILAVENMEVLTGKDAPKKREDAYKNNDIIFATPQCVENDIMRGLSLKEFSLIIFDEAHKAVGNYAYGYIAEEYVKQADNRLIIGLTASPGSDKEKIQEVSENLFIQQIEAKTEEDKDVKPYIQETQIEWVNVELPAKFDELRKIIKKILKDELSELKNKKYIKSASVDQINKGELLKVQGIIQKEIAQGLESYAAASIVASAIKVIHALELLETQGISALANYLERLKKQKSKAVRNLMRDYRMKLIIRAVNELKEKGVEHPKVDKVAEIVKKHRKKNDKIKILIFSQYRDSVDKIIEKLNESDILAHEFIGQAAKDDKAGMTQKKQIEILNKFKEGKYTALCCTSVAEEGLDIPKVDLVIFYEPIPSEIRSIQRRGRTGRSEAGKVIILMTKKTRDEGVYWASFHKERRMKSKIDKMKKLTEMDFSLGQQSLINYGSSEGSSENGKNKIKIFVDVRERNSEISKILREKADVQARQLKVGDFILSDRVCVERKTADDFLQSIIDKRLMQQASELSKNFAIPVIMVEGMENIYGRRGIHPNAIRGTIASLAVNFKISIIPTQNEADTANLLYIIAKREQEDELRAVALRGEKKVMSLREKQQFVVESLPNVSAVLARRLLEHFGSVQNVINAGEFELKQVEKIGEVKAREIRQVVKGKYEKFEKKEDK